MPWWHGRLQFLVRACGSGTVVVPMATVVRRLLSTAMVVRLVVLTPFFGKTRSKGGKEKQLMKNRV
jgi:hypothetical protein